MLSSQYLQFTKATAAGVQTITGVGFEGKALLLWSTGQTAAGATTAATLGLGMTDGILQSVRFIQHPGGEAATTSAQAERTNRIAWSSAATSGATPAATVEGQFVAFTADGFSINWITNDGAAAIYHALVLGGDLDARFVQQKITVDTGDTIDVSGLGFAPSAFIVMGGAADEFGTGDYSLGAPFGSIHGFGFSNATENVCGWTLGRGTAGAADNYRGQHTDRVSSVRTANLSGAAELLGITITAAGGNGFTITRVAGTTAHQPVQHILALSGVRFALGTFTAPTSPGDVTITPGFQARGIVLQTLQGAASANKADLGMAFGAWTDGGGSGSDSGGVWIGGVDGANPSVYRRATYTDLVLETRAASSGSVELQATVSAVTATDATITFGSASGVADAILYLAIAEGPRAILGSLIAGAYTDVTAPLAISFGLDGDDHTDNEANTFQVHGRMRVNGELIATQTYVLETIGAIVPGGAQAQGTFLISGGEIAWISAYTFRVSAATYAIGGLLYSAPEQIVTLTAADATLDRIDVIAVDTSGAVVVITGTPAATPSEPDTDPATQVKLGIVLVPAASGAASVTTTVIYAENLGSGSGEWNWTTSGTGFTLANTTAPRTGTKAIAGTAVTNGAYAQGQIGAGTVDPASLTSLVLYIRSLGAWGGNRILRVGLYSGGVLKGTLVSIVTGFLGFDSSLTGSYQQIAIPIGSFAVPVGTTINQVRIAGVGNGGAFSFYIDDVSFQAGGSSSGGGSGGITQAQGDARYVQRANNLSDLAAAATGRSNLAAAPNSPSYLVLGTNGELTSERVLTAGTGITLTDAGAGSTLTIAASGGSGAPAGASYVTLATDATLTSERVLTAGANITITDGGAGSTVTIAGTAGDVVGPSSAVASEIALFDGTTGKLIKRATGSGFVHAASGVYSAALLKRIVGAVIGTGAAVITTGVAGFVSCPVAGTITKVRLLSSDAAVTSGSIVVDVWKDTYSNYPPTVADTITASAKPTISSTTKAEDATLTGWTTSVAAGDVFGFNVDSVTSLKRVTIELTIEEA